MKHLYFLLLLLCINIQFSLAQQQTVGLFQNDSTAFNGYTLIASFDSEPAFLIDNCGLIVNSWTSSIYRPNASVYFTNQGELVRSCAVAPLFQANSPNGRIEKYDWDDNLIWSYNITDPTIQQHHDIEVLPNGNILVLAYDYKTNTETINAGRNPNVLFNELWSEKIIELQPVGNDSAVIVWEWSVWDHLVQNFDPSKSNYGDIAQHRELIDINYTALAGGNKDWIHANAIAYNPDLDQIVISARNFHEFWVIDHSTTTQEAAGHIGGNAGKGGDLLYRWGNPVTYGFEEDYEQQLHGQHNVQWIPNGYKDGGKFILYNNGLNLPQWISTVEVINPPVDASGNYTFTANQPFGPDTAEWSFESPLYSDFMSGVQRLPNGNTLICNSPYGHIMEIDTFKNTVWEYISPVKLNGIIAQGTNPGNNTLFRAERYAPNHPGLIGRTLTPTEPIEINPLPSNCVIYPNATSTSRLEELSNIRIIQNPIYSNLNIENALNQTVQVQVFNLLGQLMWEVSTNNANIQVDASRWGKGMYIVVLTSEEKGIRWKQSIIKM